jgi:glycosyltransferase involved in cell wall biosynthesis
VSNIIKIAFCTDGIFPHSVGGMQRHSRLLIEQLVLLPNIDIVVIHPHKDMQVFDTHDNLKEINIPGMQNENIYLWECFQYSKRVITVLEDYPDYVVYSQGLSVWSDIRKVSGRLIINPHGLEPFQAISFKEKITAIPFKLIFKYLFKHANNVISLGGNLTKILRKNINNSDKIVEIANAVNLPSEVTNFQKSNSPIKVLFVARFASNKGIHILLDAIEQLNKEGYDKKFIFNLAGKGPLFAYYSTQKKIDNVNYLGFISDERLSQLFSENDLFVLPTLFEGMPTVVLEAMSYNLPIIVSNVGATANLVDETNGFLIPKNNVEALKKSLVEFFNLSSESKNKLGQSSLLKVRRNFTWGKVANLHFELFSKIKL